MNLSETEAEPTHHTDGDHELVSTTYVEFREALLEDAPSK